MGAKKSLLAATGFTRQPVGVWREGVLSTVAIEVTCGS